MNCQGIVFSRHLHHHGSACVAGGYPAELWMHGHDCLPIILEGLVQGKDEGGFIDILSGDLYILATIYALRR